MNRIAIFLTVLFVLPLPAAAEEPERIVLGEWRLEGDRLIADEDLGGLFPWTPGDSVAAAVADEAATILRRSLVARGWWGATVAGRVTASTSAFSKAALTSPMLCERAKVYLNGSSPRARTRSSLSKRC